MKNTLGRYGDALALKNKAEVELRYPGAALDAPELRDVWDMQVFVHPDYQGRELVIADDVIGLVEGLNAFAISATSFSRNLDVILAFSENPGATLAQKGLTMPETVRVHGQQALHVIGPRAYATSWRWAKNQPVYLADSNWTAELLTSELPDGSCLSLRFEGADEVLQSLQARGRFRHGRERLVAVEVKCWSAAETADLSPTVEAGQSATAVVDNPYPLLRGLLVQASQGSK